MCLLLWSLVGSCPFPGWERCWTEWAPSVVADLCPGWTRATWWIWTSASGGCWMWTFTNDGWRDTGGREIHSWYNIEDALLWKMSINKALTSGSIFSNGIKVIYIYPAVWRLINILHKLSLLHHRAMRSSWGIPGSEDTIKILQNNNNTKSFGFYGLNQIILKTKNRFAEELRRCCNVENELFCPPDSVQASIFRECQGFFPESWPTLMNHSLTDR